MSLSAHVCVYVPFEYYSKNLFSQTLVQFSSHRNKKKLDEYAINKFMFFGFM